MQAQQIKSVLSKALSRIEDRGHWCMHNQAYDVYGRPVSPLGPDAVKHCAVGSILRSVYDEMDGCANNDVGDELYMQCINVLASETKGRLDHYVAGAWPYDYRAAGPEAHVVFVNDNGGHQAILRLMRRVLNHLEIEAGLDGPSKTIRIEPIRTDEPMETPSEPVEAPVEAPEAVPVPV